MSLAAVTEGRTVAAHLDAFDHQMFKVAASKGRVIVYATDAESHAQATLLSWRPRKDRRDPQSARTDFAVVEWVPGITGKVQAYLVQPVENVDRDSGFMVRSTSLVVETVVCDMPAAGDQMRWERKVLKWLASHDVAAAFAGEPADRHLVVPGVDKHIVINTGRSLVYVNGELTAPMTASARPAAQTRQDATK